MKNLLLLIIATSFFACGNPFETETAEKKKKPPVVTPAPTPCGRVVPDVILTGVATKVYTNQLQLSFDPLTNVNNYILYYQQAQGTSTNGVTIDGLWYRQASAGYPYLPIYVTFGWSPMYLNSTYTCRVGIYFNGGCYSYSAPFTVNTSL